jgi:hypothetical protein
MKSKLSAIFVGTFALAGAIAFSPAAPAWADAMLVGTTGDATGVTGLVVDGTSYDVTFVHDSYAMFIHRMIQLVSPRLTRPRP